MAIFEDVARPSVQLKRAYEPASQRDVTLIYAARDEVHNGAVVLRDELEAALGRAHQSPETR